VRKWGYLSKRPTGTALGSSCAHGQNEQESRKSDKGNATLHDELLMDKFVLEEYITMMKKLQKYDTKLSVDQKYPEYFLHLLPSSLLIYNVY